MAWSRSSTSCSKNSGRRVADVLEKVARDAVAQFSQRSVDALLRADFFFRRRQRRLRSRCADILIRFQAQGAVDVPRRSSSSCGSVWCSAENLSPFAVNFQNPRRGLSESEARFKRSCAQPMRFLKSA